MKKIFGIILTGIIFNFVVAQNYQEDFQKYLQAKDAINQLKTLTKWKKVNSKDPELFISYFNYYLNKSINKRLVVVAGEPPKGEKHLSLSDNAGNNAGFISNRINYDKSYLKRGLNKINEGIRLYPNRLDMRFGKIYILGEIKDWDSFTKEIIKTIDYSAINNNQWTWTNNEKHKADKSSFLSSLQDYQAQLYYTENDDLLINMREIATKILEYYPNHIESLSNLSITYLLTGDYDKGIESLLKADIINPRNHIVLLNIAQGFKLKGDKKKAIEYFEKTIDFGGKRAKQYAKQQIKKLKEE